MRYVTTHGALAADTHAQRPASVSLRTAMLEGLAPDGGLYVPESIEPWRDAEIARLPERTLTEIAYRALRPYTRPELDATTFEAVVAEALNFPIPLVEVEPGKLLVFTTWFDRTDPDRPLFDPVTEGILHSKLLVSESNDHGETFGPWREIPTPGLTGTAFCGPPVHWSDGSIGLAFESFKHYDDPKPAWHCA